MRLSRVNCQQDSSLESLDLAVAGGHLENEMFLHLFDVLRCVQVRAPVVALL